MDEFIIRRQKEHSGLPRTYGVARDIGVAAKIVNCEVNKAGLLNILGLPAMKLMAIPYKNGFVHNEKLIECLKNKGECAGISEENEEFIPILRSIEKWQIPCRHGSVGRLVQY
ncbi:MAG: hypothetical protein R2788_00955 [Saprospiraceae bacterium]